MDGRETGSKDFFQRDALLLLLSVSTKGRSTTVSKLRLQLLSRRALDVAGRGGQLISLIALECGEHEFKSPLCRP